MQVLQVLFELNKRNFPTFVRKIKNEILCRTTCETDKKRQSFSVVHRRKFQGRWSRRSTYHLTLSNPDFMMKSPVDGLSVQRWSLQRNQKWGAEHRRDYGVPQIYYAEFAYLVTVASATRFISSYSKGIFHLGTFIKMLMGLKWSVQLDAVGLLCLHKYLAEIWALLPLCRYIFHCCQISVKNVSSFTPFLSHSLLSNSPSAWLSSSALYISSFLQTLKDF